MNAVIENMIDEALKGNVVKRKGRCWFMNSSACVSLIDLQKSAWGNQYYINIASSLKTTERSSYPKESACEIRIRLTQIVSNRAELEHALNLDFESMADARRRSIIVDSIRSVALPLARRLMSRSGMIEFIASPLAKKALISMRLKKALNV